MRAYSAFVEFGTGDLVDVPEVFKKVALTFKGKGIRKRNGRPQPFMYPAYLKGKKIFIKDLNKMYNDLVKKYNNE